MYFLVGRFEELETNSNSNKFNINYIGDSMKSSELRNKEEEVTLFSSSTQVEAVQLFKFDADYNLTDITEDTPNIESMGNGHKKYDFTCPDEDCQILSIFNGYAVMFNVGQPEIRFIHYAKTTGLSIPFKRIDDAGDIIEDGTLTELSDGFYYHVPSDLGISIYVVNGISSILKVPYNKDNLAGQILLQKDKWQLLSVPIEGKIYEDLIVKIEDKYGVDGADIFESFNAYPATNSQSSEFLSFIPNVTNTLTKHNFDLIMTDLNGEKEVLGFWAKTKNYAGDELVFDWSRE